MTKLYIRGLNIFVVLSQIMNVVGVYEKHFFVVVFYVLKELNRLYLLHSLIYTTRKILH